jgi:hypothetical protein
LVNNKNGTVTDEIENRLKDLFGNENESDSPKGKRVESFKEPVRELEEISAVADAINENDALSPGGLGNSTEPTEDKDGRDDSSLRDLKAIVLSIDWEINDETMKGLVDETERLKDVYEDDRTLVLLFQLLCSVGKYVKSKKAGSHPDSIKLLSSIYSSLEKVMLSKGMTETARKKELFTQVTKFKELKEQIALKKGTTAGKREPAPQGIPAKLTVEHPKGTGIQEESRPGEEAVREVMGPDTGHMPPHEAFAFALEEIKAVIKAEFKALRAELKLWRDKT